MPANRIELTIYTASDRPELLRLSLELHSDYFLQNASRQIQEVQQEKDIKNSYENYLDFIETDKDKSWKIFLAKTQENKIAGFIIGSVVADEELVLSKIGRFEDWFVESQFRRQGIGMSLYNALEKWFIETGCKQVHSDTWQGNELSIKAHRQLGFFVSGIQFSKKI